MSAFKATHRTDAEIRSFLGVGDDTDVQTTGGVVDLDKLFEDLHALFEFAIVRLRADDVSSPGDALRTGLALGVGIFAQQLGISDGANPGAAIVNEIMARDPNPEFGVVAPSSRSVN